MRVNEDQFVDKVFDQFSKDYNFALTKEKPEQDARSNSLGAFAKYFTDFEGGRITRNHTLSTCGRTLLRKMLEVPLESMNKIAFKDIRVTRKFFRLFLKYIQVAVTVNKSKSNTPFQLCFS